MMMLESLVKFSMAGLLFATVPVGGDLSQWGNWGLAGLVVGYTLFRDWHRERRMSEAIDKHQTWVRETLIKALERNTIAIEQLNSRSNIETPRSIHGNNH